MRLLATQNGLPRVSWGAVIAGVILSLIVYLILSVLGTAIGASLLSPMSAQRNAGVRFRLGRLDDCDHGRRCLHRVPISLVAARQFLDGCMAYSHGQS
jgi:vacuolar-type H+-ATPase subunit I/STV1